MNEEKIEPAVLGYLPVPLWQKILLWTLAVLLSAAAMIYQRRTGPTYPLRGSFTVEEPGTRRGKAYQYKLIRTHETDADAQVEIPNPRSSVLATLWYKRYRTDDPFTGLDMRPLKSDHSTLAASLPKQPAAGKLEYYIALQSPDFSQKLAKSDEENVLIRFKDPVPDWILIPHVVAMIFVILFGMRAALAAVFTPNSMRLYSWMTLILMTIGGLVLGPIVQKYAFGEYWTGFPFGSDWTDNKLLFMWLAWLVACVTIGFSIRKKETVGRGTVVVAALVMTVVYLIPHSMGGSELDYSQVDQGINPQEAIRTGKQ